MPGLRLAGYSAALGEHGLRIDPTLEESGKFTAQGGRIAMERLLTRPDPPTAVFAMSDEMAFGAWRAINDAGLSWPDDVAVVGVDDHELAEMVDLTTVRLSPRELGAAAARRLLASIGCGDDPAADRTDRLDVIELVPRTSTIGMG